MGSRWRAALWWCSPHTIHHIRRGYFAMKRTVLAAMLLATTAGGVAVWQGPALAQTVMGTKSGVDQALLARKANPGDDFNAYANGVWLKTAEIPADRSTKGVGLDVSDVAAARTADIIQNAGAARAKTGA